MKFKEILFQAGLFFAAWIGICIVIYALEKTTPTIDFKELSSINSAY